MLDPRSWLDRAQALDEGRKARVTHDCGPGSCMIIEHKREGWSAYCHRCADHGWKGKPMPSLAERVAQKEAQRHAEAEMERDPRPPYPAVFDVEQWPLEARVWLFKAGLFRSDIEKLGAYYHERSKRVVLPVVQDGQLVYWQARNVGLSGPDAPKYLNCKVERHHLVAAHGTGPEIVLTEDILSAFRVGMATEAWSLLGTKLHTPILARLIASKRPVFVWLDDDHERINNPGQAAAATICRSLANVGVPHYNIRTRDDPKLLTRAQIQEVLHESRRKFAATDEAPQELQAADPHGQ